MRSRRVNKVERVFYSWWILLFFPIQQISSFILLLSIFSSKFFFQITKKVKTKEPQMYIKFGLFFQIPPSSSTLLLKSKRVNCFCDDALLLLSWTAFGVFPQSRPFHRNFLFKTVSSMPVFSSYFNLMQRFEKSRFCYLTIHISWVPSKFSLYESRQTVRCMVR